MQQNVSILQITKHFLQYKHEKLGAITYIMTPTGFRVKHAHKIV